MTKNGQTLAALKKTSNLIYQNGYVRNPKRCLDQGEGRTGHDFAFSADSDTAGGGPRRSNAGDFLWSE